MRRGGGALIVAALLCACVGPVRSFEVYEGKAAAIAESVASAVQTARLAAAEAAGARAFAPYLSIVLSEVEGDAGDSGDVFAAIQPPDERSAQLRTQLLTLIDRAESVLADLRIAARWGELGRLADIAASLGELGEQLAGFAEAHS